MLGLADVFEIPVARCGANGLLGDYFEAFVVICRSCVMGILPILRMDSQNHGVKAEDYTGYRTE